MKPAARRAILAAGTVALTGLMLVGDLPAWGTGAAPISRKVVFRQDLSNAPGKTLSGILIELAPGAAAKPHRHRSGTVMAYVLSGAIRSRVEGGADGVYRAGESWYEPPPGSHHTITENASSTEAAQLLAIFVAETGAPLSEDDQ